MKAPVNKTGDPLQTMAMSEVRVRATNAPGSYRTHIDIETGGHVLLADEPSTLGGSDNGPESHSLLASSLAACMVMTLRMYADRKHWPLGEVHSAITLRTENPASGFKTSFEVEIQLSGPLDLAQRARLLEIAGKCPVHKILQHPIHIQAKLLP
jgi:putative redox protein